MLRSLTWKPLITFGLLAGLIQVAAGVVMYLARVYFAPWSIFVSLAALFLCIVFGTPIYRDSALKGQITYRQALMVGIVVSVCTGIVYAVYNLISISFIYPNFVEQMIAASETSVLRSEQTPESIAAMRGLTATTIALGNLIRLSVLGSFLSVFAAFINRTKS